MSTLILRILSYKMNACEVFYWMERRFSHLASLCGLVFQHPNMPVLIHTSKRKSFQDPDHPRGSPTRRHDVKSSLPTVPLIGRNLAPAFKGHIEAPGKRCAQTPSLTCVFFSYVCQIHLTAFVHVINKNLLAMDKLQIF